MNGREVITGGFVVAVSVGAWQEITHPNPKNPLSPLPAPYRFAGAAMAYGLLALVADFIEERIAGMLAVGLTLGLLMNTFAKEVPGKTAGPDTAQV